MEEGREERVRGCWEWSQTGLAKDLESFMLSLDQDLGCLRVTSSSLFLLCFSASLSLYKLSPTCRSEVSIVGPCGKGY